MRIDHTIKTPAKRMARLGILLGIIFVLSLLESVIVLPFMPPHFRLGLANIVIMFVLLSYGKWTAFLFVGLKAAFVLVTRGVMAGSFSLVGGMLAVLIIVLIVKIEKQQQIGLAAIGIIGAVFHNLGQFLVFMVWLAFMDMEILMFVYYVPVLIITGIIAGFLTGTLLKILMPILNRL